MVKVEHSKKQKGIKKEQTVSKEIRFGDRFKSDEIKVKLNITIRRLTQRST